MTSQESLLLGGTSSAGEQEEIGCVLFAVRFKLTGKVV